MSTNELLFTLKLDNVNLYKLARYFKVSKLSQKLLGFVNADKKELAIQTLDRMESTMPRSILPMDFGLLYEIGNIYLNAGGRKQYESLVPEIEEKGWQMITDNPTDVQSYWNPYRILLDCPGCCKG